MDDSDPILERRLQRERSRLWMAIGVAGALCVVMFFAGFGVGRVSKDSREASSPPRSRVDRSDVVTLDEFEHITDNLKKKK
jgi:hypothetical protein